MTAPRLAYHGGLAAAGLPFLLFAGGVMGVALSGAPDERGFWPILLAALALGMLLAKDRRHYGETVIRGMAQPLVMVMLMAWMLSACLGVLMAESGLVKALLWSANSLQLTAGGFTAAAFAISCLLSFSTGSSFATILLGGPLLYPAGAMLGADLPWLAGAILAGATFGDFFAPISDTTIASALSQDAEIGPTVKGRLRYILPVAILCLPLYYRMGQGINTLSGTQDMPLGNPAGLPMLLLPLGIIYHVMRGRDLLHGLLLGLVAGMLWGWMLGLLPADKIFSLDKSQFQARSILIDGINKALGISIFTLLLMGLTETFKASGLMDAVFSREALRDSDYRHGEKWIAALGSAAVLLTTHSVVAILLVADFCRQTGERIGISPSRRADLLSLVVCIFPFLLPYFIPVILMASTSAGSTATGIPGVSPLEAGSHNMVSWGLAAMTLITLLGKKQK